MADYEVPDAVTWLPDGGDVAALIRARTKSRDGAELGAFTADTRPTAAQVDELVSMSAHAVHSRTGWEIPAEWREEARRMIAHRAAMAVELSYFPEQVSAGRSSYDQLRALYDEGMAVLVAALADNQPNDQRVHSLLAQSGVAGGSFPYGMAVDEDGVPLTPGFGAYSLVAGAAFAYDVNPFGFDLHGQQHGNGMDLPPDGGAP